MMAGVYIVHDGSCSEQEADNLSRWTADAIDKIESVMQKDLSLEQYYADTPEI